MKAIPPYRLTLLGGALIAHRLVVRGNGQTCRRFLGATTREAFPYPDLSGKRQKPARCGSFISQALSHP